MTAPFACFTWRRYAIGSHHLFFLTCKEIEETNAVGKVCFVKSIVQPFEIS